MSGGDSRVEEVDCEALADVDRREHKCEDCIYRR
jgi:hypothetical protein